MEDITKLMENSDPVYIWNTSPDFYQYYLLYEDGSESVVEHPDEITPHIEVGGRIGRET